MKIILFLATFIIATNVDIYMARAGAPGMGLHVGAALALAAAFLATTVKRQALSLKRFAPFLLLFIIFMLWSLLSAFFSLDVELSLLTLTRYLVIFVSMALLASLVGLRRDYDRAVAAGLFAALVVVAGSILIDAFWPGTFSKQLTRAAGLYINPNGGAQALVLIYTGLLVVWRKAQMDRAMVIAYIIVLAGVFLTLSRSGVVLLVMLSIFMSYIYFSRRLALYATLTIMFVSIVAFLFGDFGGVSQFQNATTVDRLERLFTLDAYLDQEDSRVELLRAYLGSDVGLLGWGPGASAVENEFGGATHNTYAKMYWESGVFAAILYGMMVLSALTVNRSKTAFVAVAGALALGVFTNYNPDNRLFYFVLLAVCATGERHTAPSRQRVA